MTESLQDINKIGKQSLNTPVALDETTKINMKPSSNGVSDVSNKPHTIANGSDSKPSSDIPEINVSNSNGSASADDSITPSKHKRGNILVVSNRLPVTINRSADGSYEYKMSSGGLVSALSGLKKTRNFKWFGWPGLEIPDAEKKRVYNDLVNLHNSIPVFLSEELADLHYNGFSNS